jgi:ABC-type uncharacterized transport system permease subunit
MDRARTITAYFTGNEGPYEITVPASIYASGSTTINTSFGIVNCSATQTSSGIVVNITAVAAQGYRFDGWKGNINGSKASMSFIANSSEASETITAEFSKSQQSLWIWVAVGIVALLTVGLLIYKATFGRAKKSVDNPPQPDIEQQINPAVEDNKIEH